MLWIKLLTAAAFAIPISFALFCWYMSSLLDDREKITSEVLALHQLKELPPAGSDLAAKIDDEISQRAHDDAYQIGHQEARKGKFYWILALGPVIGLTLAFTGILPWCKRPNLNRP